MNKVQLLGRLASEPVLRYTHANNVPVVSFSIAVSRRKINGKEQQPDFFDVTAWQGTADFVKKHFTKGSPICLDGRLQQRIWTDDTNVTRYAVGVVAESVHFAGFKRDDSQNNVAGSVPETDAANYDPFENEVAA